MPFQQIMNNLESRRETTHILIFFQAQSDDRGSGVAFTACAFVSNSQQCYMDLPSPITFRNSHFIDWNSNIQHTC